MSPKQIPDHLHWFYWESYSTWLTGFALFTVLYLYPGRQLPDRQSLPRLDAGGRSRRRARLPGRVLDRLRRDHRAFGGGEKGDLIVGLGVTAFVVFAAWLACHLFAGRAAFLLVRAMVAHVDERQTMFFWIIPGQRKVIAPAEAGQPVNRSTASAPNGAVHNTYFRCRLLSRAQQPL